MGSISRFSCAGAHLYGTLPAGHIGDTVMEPIVPDLDTMWHKCHSDNVELLGSLREDVNSEALHAIACSDSELHRMTAPVKATEIDLRRVQPHNHRPDLLSFALRVCSPR